MRPLLRVILFLRFSKGTAVPLRLSKESIHWSYQQPTKKKRHTVSSKLCQAIPAGIAHSLLIKSCLKFSVVLQERNYDFFSSCCFPSP